MNQRHQIVSLCMGQLNMCLFSRKAIGQHFSFLHITCSTPLGLLFLFLFHSIQTLQAANIHNPSRWHFNIAVESLFPFSRKSSSVLFTAAVEVANSPMLGDIVERDFESPVPATSSGTTGAAPALRPVQAIVGQPFPHIVAGKSYSRRSTANPTALGPGTAKEDAASGHQRRVMPPPSHHRHHHHRFRVLRHFLWGPVVCCPPAAVAVAAAFTRTRRCRRWRPSASRAC